MQKKLHTTTGNSQPSLRVTKCIEKSKLSPGNEGSQQSIIKHIND